MTPCSSCGRHGRGEAACPFCHAPAPAPPRLARLALGGALLASVVSGCPQPCYGVAASVVTPSPEPSASRTPG